MSLLSHARTELDLIGMTADNEDEMNRMMREHILTMVEVFSNEGHSGFSGKYAIDTLTRLLDFKTLSALTGNDDEWVDVSQYGGRGDGPLYQNKRCSSVFKDSNGAYDIDGKVFWEWAQRPYDEDEPGYPGVKIYKSYYTGSGSRVPVTFPYIPPKEPIYEYKQSDAEPRTPPQNEEGFL